MSSDTEQPVMKGTPITRGGGNLIRVGWRAEGYSVSAAKEKAYLFYTILLFVVGVALGIAIAYGVDVLYFTYIAPQLAKFVPEVKNYPSLILLLIYYLTLFFGGIIFWSLRGMVGKSLIRNSNRLHEGYTLLEQRRRACIKRKRDFVLRIFFAGVLWFIPADINEALRLFLVSLPLLPVLEGFVFRIWKPQE